MVALLPPQLAVVYLCPAVHSACCKVRPACIHSHSSGLSRGALQDCRVGHPARVMALVEGEEGRLTPDSLAALLSRPWLINRVTCGTIVTWSKVDATTHDTIVSLDVCLLGLITANIFLFGPLLLSRAAGLSSPGLGTMMGYLRNRYDTILVPLTVVSTRLIGQFGPILWGKVPTAHTFFWLELQRK